MEEKFAQAIKELKQEHEQNMERQRVHLQQKKTAQQSDMEQVQRLVNTFRETFVECDEHLWSADAAKDAIGFTISYEKQTESVRPTFSVQATCNNGQTTVKVTDGRWQQIPGTLGSWADWTDEMQVYSGMFNEKAITQEVQKAFVQWYREALDAPDEEPSLDS